LEVHPQEKLCTILFPLITLIRIFENEVKEVIIGRTPECDIKIDDKLLSKLQCSMVNDDGTWILIDGYDGKGSTNGTWIYYNEDYEMKEGMVFKANQTIFNVKINE
jgi:predicted component of type VI protein secretion system